MKVCVTLGQGGKLVVRTGDQQLPVGVGFMERVVCMEKKSEEVRPEIFVQYRSNESSLDDVEARIREQYFRKEEAPITSMQIYVKPEDMAAYYVINEGVVGKVSLY